MSSANRSSYVKNGIDLITRSDLVVCPLFGKGLEFGWVCFPVRVPAIAIPGGQQ